METASIKEAKVFLYGQPVESFIAERDVLVKAIRAGGDRALANEVKALRKPSAVAAEVNQIVRADPDGVELILQAASLLRSAQAGALDGTTISASELQQQYRDAIQALAQSATTKRAEVRAALEAATIDEASNEDLRTGCLVVVPTPVSIFGSGPAVTASRKSKPESVAEQRPGQPVDELEQRRALRRVDKAAENKADDKKSATAKKKTAAAAAERQREADEKKAAAQAERARKAAEKERQKQLREVQKRHREAVRAHLAALDEEEAASQAIETAARGLIETDDEIAAAEQALVQLRERREQAVAARNLGEDKRAEAHQRAEAAETAVDNLADTLTALEESLP